MSDNLIVLILGILYSFLLHIARSMQRYGIHSFDRFRQHLKGNQQNNPSENARHHIYILGLILSNASVIFVIVAGRFGTTSYFTSMYGAGMLPMLLFSHYIMKERSRIEQWIGVLIIITGCVFMGISAHVSSSNSMTEVNPLNLLIVLLLIALLTPLVISYGKKNGNRSRDAMAAGFIAGAIASLDPILKATGQNYGAGNGLIPAAPLGWLLFLLSFASTTSALLITQYAYSRRVSASQLIPYYNVAFVIIPVFVQKFILPVYKPGKNEMIGILIMVLGIIIFSLNELRVSR